MRYQLGLVCLLVAGCGSGASKGDPVGTSVQKVIGNMGGTVTTPAGASIVIPAGALPNDTMISITASANVPPSMYGTAVGVNYLFGPSGTLFLKPVTMNLPFGDLPAGVDASKDLQILTAPDNSNQYTSLGPAHLIDAHHAGATTLHFSQCVASTIPTGSGSTTGSGGTGGTTGTTGGTPGQCVVSCLGGDTQTNPNPGGTTGSGGTPDAGVPTMDAGTGGTTTGSGGSTTTTGSTGGTTGAPTSCKSDLDCPSGTTCVNGVCGGSGPVADGGTGGTSGTSTCGCQDACNGNSYQLVCDGMSCSCIQNGVTTMMFGQNAVCSDSYTAWIQLCGFPANMTQTGPMSDGGTPTMVDAGTDPGGGCKVDGDCGPGGVCMNGICSGGGTTGTTGTGGTPDAGGPSCTPMCAGDTVKCTCDESCTTMSYHLVCNGTACTCNSANGPIQFTAAGTPCDLNDFHSMCGAP
jgi:hypothetical protein